MPMKNDSLPPNCPMKLADYEHYCPSPSHGLLTYTEHGECFKQSECSKVVKDFKKMKIPTSSSLRKDLKII
jgi:hypothetical protein